jgi:putative ABC transport system permease protein
MSRMSLLTLRSLRVRLSRTLLTTFGIVLGVAVILAISITNQSTIDSITAVFSEASGKAHLVVTSSSTGNPGFPEDVLRRVVTIPDVKAAIPSLRDQALLADEALPSGLDISMFGAVAGGLMIYGIDPSLDPQAREYRMVAGQFLSPDLDAYDIVLVKDYADENGIEVGHDISILTLAGPEVVRVVGLMSKEGPGLLNSGAFGVIPLEAAQEIFGRLGDLDQIDIVATPDTASAAGLDELKAALQTRLGDKYTVMYPAAQGKRVTQMLDTYQMGLNFVSVMALFVGAFLIYNAFSMTVVERTREIGMLRTVGMTKRQVMVQILTEAGMLGIVGSLLGIGAGILLSQGLIRVMEFLLAQEVQEIRVPLGGLTVSVLVGVCVTLVASAIPAWQAGRISPLEALRIRGNPHEGWVIRRGWPLGVTLVGVSSIFLAYAPLPIAVMYRIGPPAVFVVFVGAMLLIPSTVGGWERIARPWMRRIYGSEGQLGSSNIQRAKLRTALTVAALMVGAAMILTIRSLTKSYAHDLRAWIDVYIGGDLYAYSSLPMRADLARRLEGVEGVAAVTPTRYFDVEHVKPDGGDEHLTFMAIDPMSYPRVTSFVFAAGQGDPEPLLNRLAAGDAVFVSRVLSDMYTLEQGDTIRLKTKRGEREFEVAAVVVNYQNNGLVVEGSWNDMRRYFALNDVSAFLLKVQPGYSPEEVRDRIEHLYGERRHLTVESNKALKARALSLTAQANALFDVLVLIAMVVASLGVVNTLTMNVLERTQEIGMLRSVGMTRRQVGRMILAEAGMMGLIGGAFGLVLGLFLSRLFLIATASTEGYEVTYVLPTEGILVSLLIALVVSQLAAIWPARRAAGIRIIEAIQCE